MHSSTEVVYEIPNTLRVYNDGRVERFSNTNIVPASVDPATGVSSKDVVIDPLTGVSARLYLPKVDDFQPGQKLPLLIYYHGGGFLMESAFSLLYHNYINSLSSQARILVVSVEYRLAPEHPLPAAYDDAWLALKWADSHKSGGGGGPGKEEWLLKYARLDRMFVSGDSAGGNITHNMGMRAGGLDKDVSLEGVVLVHPYFWGMERLEFEKTGEFALDPKIADDMWPFVCPGTTNDDPRINPFAEGAPALARFGCKRALVCVAGKDLLSGRGRVYYEKLRESGWKGEVEMLESEEEDHVFHLFKPQCVRALEMMEVLVRFFNVSE